MIFKHVFFHGLIYGFLTTGYLFAVMALVSPRVWGYVDYPQRVKDKAPSGPRFSSNISSEEGYRSGSPS